MSLPGDLFGNPVNYFPSAFVVEIAKCLREYMPDHSIVERTLHSADPSGAVGVYAEEWVPDLDSFEMGNVGPTLSTYRLCVRNLIKGTDEAMMRALFANDAKAIKVILYRDPELRVRLGELQEEMMGMVERFQRFTIVRQQYLSARMSGGFQFVATTDVTITTESTRL